MDCGHCPACIQEKVQRRVLRIHNTAHRGYICLMVGLTYEQRFVPYVLKDDLERFSVDPDCEDLKVYRDQEVRRVRVKDLKTGKMVIRYKYYFGRSVINEVPFQEKVSLDGMKHLRDMPNRFGVCFYPDVQKFLKRLRERLERVYGYTNKIFVYCCSEYGEKSLRPHFHLLIFCEESIEAWLCDSIRKSWKYSNMRRFPKSIQRATDAATYVASYVSCLSHLSDFNKLYFCPKHSYSKGFGLGNEKFSLANILYLFNRGSLSYTRKVLSGTQVREFVVPLPKYVINRYFPKFKASSRIAPVALYEVMRRIINDETRTDLGIDFFDTDFRNVYLKSCFSNGDVVAWSDADLHTICVSLSNAFMRFRNDYFSINGVFVRVQEYLWYYERIWSMYSSTILKLHHERDDIPYFEKYDNLEVLFPTDKSMVPVPIFDSDFKPVDTSKIRTLDSNLFYSNRQRTAQMEQGYYKQMAGKHTRYLFHYNMQGVECNL